MLVGSDGVERKQGCDHFSPFADCLTGCLGIAFKASVLLHALLLCREVLLLRLFVCLAAFC